MGTTMDESYSPERRRLLRRLGAAVGAFFTVLIGIPAGATVLDPLLRRGDAAWTEAGPADAVQEGQATRFAYEVRAGWETRRQVGFLVREGETILALSARCTHAGCTVRFREGRFHCPCHAGVFSLTGQPLEGPPESPLVRLETRVENGRVQVKT
jgi:Rieske Fe-S protein